VTKSKGLAGTKLWELRRTTAGQRAALVSSVELGRDLTGLCDECDGKDVHRDCDTPSQERDSER